MSARAGSVLEDLIDRLEFREELRASRVWVVWNGVVGPLLAEKAEPLRLEGGRLVVRVASSAWMQELQLLRDEIRTRLNERLGTRVVREIYLILGKVEPPESPSPQPSSHPVDEQAIARLVPDTGHPEIDEALRRIARARARRLGPGA